MLDVPPHTPGYCAKTVDGESDPAGAARARLHHSETLSLRAAHAPAEVRRLRAAAATSR